jgi:hypothetical protein
VSDEAFIPGRARAFETELGTGNWMPLVADESLPGAAIYQNG